MRIVTSRARYIDIDAYAGCVAYAELLEIQGEEARAVSTAPLNESITKTVRSWPAKFSTDYSPSVRDEYIVIDVSDPEHFDIFVQLTRVTEIIDHHPGFEQYWHEKLGEKAQIERVGSVATRKFNCGCLVCSISNFKKA